MNRLKAVGYKTITVYGIYLRQDSNGSLQVLLVKDCSNRTGFRLPGGKVIISSRGKQLKKEKHNLRKFVYMQSGYNLETKKPSGLPTCIVYTWSDEIYKVYDFKKTKKIISGYWSRDKKFMGQMFDLRKILHDEEVEEIEYTTELILKNFRSLKWRKYFKSQTLVPVKPLAVAS
ncbi:MAG: hypothetical protein PHC97_03175 [Patescibacteria group bacterium]|nr:hypothetical protein [Patescibacteria group bacterium]